MRRGLQRQVVARPHDLDLDILAFFRRAAVFRYLHFRLRLVPTFNAHIAVQIAQLARIERERKGLGDDGLVVRYVRAVFIERLGIRVHGHIRRHRDIWHRRWCRHSRLSDAHDAGRLTRALEDVEADHRDCADGADEDDGERPTERAAPTRGLRDGRKRRDLLRLIGCGRARVEVRIGAALPCERNGGGGRVWLVPRQHLRGYVVVC